ncbi:MAG: pyridoxal phosphate-dependent aminotransferase [bacterium]
MLTTSKRLLQFPEYVFSSLAKEAKKIEETSGKKILNLSIGSPDFPPGEIYVKKLKEYIDTPGSHLYPGYGATRGFANGLIHWYKTRFGVELNQNELFPLLGAKDGVSHIAMALVDEGDEILVPNPGYPAFTGPALIMGCTVVPYALLEENQFKLSLSEIEKKITEKTRMIWVNFPSNPTGQVISLSELEPLVALCRKKNIWLVYDNAYAEITYGGCISPSILEIPGAKDIAVEIGSFSKMYSFAGFRMGWIVGNAQAIAALAKIKSQFDSGLSLPFQELAAYAFVHPDIQWHKEMIDSYMKKKETLMKIFASFGLIMNNPKGGLYLWAKIPEAFQNANEYTMELLKTKYVLVTPGSAFGTNGNRYVRICFSADITHLSHYV